MTQPTVAQDIVRLYRAFYRGQRTTGRREISAIGCVKPLQEALSIIARTPPSERSPEALEQSICGGMLRLMNRIRSTSETLGRWVIEDRAEERQAIAEFAEYIVNLFYEKYGGEVAKFSGNQQKMLEHSCEFVYRLEDDKEKSL